MTVPVIKQLNEMYRQPSPHEGVFLNADIDTAQGNESVNFVVVRNFEQPRKYYFLGGNGKYHLGQFRKLQNSTGRI